MNVSVNKTKIEDVKIFQPEVFNDDRGYLIESFSEKNYKDHLLNTNFVQDNESKSSYGTLRGLHFQEKPFEQAKLVRVIKGEIQDIAVDLRKESKTYKQYVSVLLNETNKKQLYVPRGFAHGFLVLSDEAIVHYKMDNLYKHEFNNGIRYDDPKINIKWKLDRSKILISGKDNKLNYL